MSDQSKETPADKLKREKAEKAQQDALDAEKQKLTDAAAAEADAIARDNEILAEKQRKADEDLAKDDAAMKEYQAKVSKAAEAAINDDQPEATVEEDDPAPANAQQDAAKQLETIALAYPLTTPDEHIVFGFGGNMFRLGQLRALFNLKRGGA